MSRRAKHVAEPGWWQLYRGFIWSQCQLSLVSKLWRSSMRTPVVNLRNMTGQSTQMFRRLSAGQVTPRWQFLEGCGPRITTGGKSWSCISTSTTPYSYRTPWRVRGPWRLWTTSWLLSPGGGWAKMVKTDKKKNDSTGVFSITQECQECVWHSEAFQPVSLHI